MQGEGYGEVLVKHLTQLPDRPSSIRGVSPHVEAVCLKALEKKPDSRYPNMAEFMKALADPVGYVEQNGGIEGFASRHLGPATAEVEAPFSPLASGPSPYPVAPITPPPGHISSGLPVPVPGTFASSPAGESGAPTVPSPTPGVAPTIPSPSIATPPPLGHGYGSHAGPMPMPPGEPPNMQPVMPTPMAAVSYAPFSAAPGQGSRLKWVVIAGALVVVAAVAVFVALGQRSSKEPSGEPAIAAATNQQPRTAPGTGQPAVGNVQAPPDAAPAAPAKVVFKFESTPPGASIFIGESSEPAGTTPTELSLPKQDSPIWIRFAKEGFADQTKQYTPNANNAIDVTLAALEEGSRDGRDSKRKRDRDRSSKPKSGDDGFEILGDDAKKTPNTSKKGEDDFGLIR